MDVRRGFVALSSLVAVTALSYAVLFNGNFSDGHRLPVGVVAASVATTLAAAVCVLWWLGRVAGWRAPPLERGSADVFIALLAVGVVSELLAVGAELLLNAPGLWLVIPTSTIGYGLFIVWFQKRYGST